MTLSIKGLIYDTQYSDIQHNDNQHKGLIYDTQHNGIQHNDTQYKGLIYDSITTLSIMTLSIKGLFIKYNDFQHNYIRY
jgi:hypothetical protein